MLVRGRPDAGLGALRPRRRFADGAAEQLERSGGVSRLLPAVPGAHEPPPQRRVVGRGREAHRILEQLGRSGGRPARERAGGTVLDRRSDLGGGLRRRGGEVSRALLRRVGQVGERAVDGPPPPGRQAGERTRHEQWMREPHAIALLLDDAGVERRLQHRLVRQRPREDGCPRLAERGDDTERRARRLRQGPHAGLGQALDTRRPGQRLRRELVRGGAGRRRDPGELDGEEGVACCDRGDPPHDRPRKTLAELARDEPGQRLDVERGDGHPMPRDRDGIARRLELSGARGREEQHGRLSQSAQCERQRPGRGRVQPLQVVDRKENGRLLRSAAQQSECTGGDRSGLRIGVRSVLAKQRHAERRPLRRRQRAAVLVEDVAQEIDEPSRRGRRLDLRRARHQDATALRVRVLEPHLPDRRLPDARGPFEDQRRRRRPVEEPTDGLHLGLATKDLRDGHDSGVGGVLPQNQRQRPTISPRRALRSSPDGVRGVVSKLRPMAAERTGT